MTTGYLFDTPVTHTFDTLDLARWTGGQWHGRPAGLIHGFSIDTRTLQPGDLFVALRGDRADGHNHLAAAFAAGASAVMVDRADSLHDSRLPHVLVEHTRAALLALGRGYRQTLTGRMAAVTGSVGKTTVKELLADMLTHIGVTARSKGNWNNDLGLPLSLLAAPPGLQFGVFELGMNHPGELDPLCDVLEPDVGIITCIGPVHIENFANEAGIADEKAAIYRGLRGRGIAIVNADDNYAGQLCRHARGSRLVMVSGKSTAADYAYRRSDPARGRFEIRERDSGETVELSAPLPGEYFVMDAALAAAAARVMGAPWHAIRHAIEFYQPLAMRWNRQHVAGVHIINDAYNANPVSLRAAMQAYLEEPVKGARWIVLAGMLELGVEEERMHREAGVFVAGLDDVRLVTVGRRGAWIAEGARAAGMAADRLHVVSDHAAAARLLDEALAPHDAVLLKASRGESLEKVIAEWKTLREKRERIN